MDEKVQPVTRLQNLVVARFRDGRILKGITHDFGPQKKVFHVIPVGADGKTQNVKISEVSLTDLKAVFFVKSLQGKKDHPPQKGMLDEKGIATGSTKVKITFYDGEILVGTTHGYNPNREGFFVFPAETDSNNLRVFIVSGAVKEIETRK
jgi:hypothetical protein